VASIERTQACLRALVGAQFVVSAKNRARESAAAIRAKNPLWRAQMRRDAGDRENFFIAKNGDSESTTRAFGRHRRVAKAATMSASRDAELQKRLRRNGFL
jgi:hypothetical protein